MEGYGPSTYGDAFADVYDEWYGPAGPGGAHAVEDAVGTLARLARAAAGGRRRVPAVLELGVGTGRLAVPLAASDVEVWGIDASTAMLERLRGRPGGGTVHAVAGDVADVPGVLAAADAPPCPPDGFDLVVVACNTFFLLADEASQRRCLQGVAAVLAPRGRFVIEAYVPAQPPAEEERRLEVRQVELDRVVLAATRHLPAERTVVGQHIELRDGTVRLRPWVLHYAAPAELDELAAAAGLSLEHRWAGWDRQPFAPDSLGHVSSYRLTKQATA